MNDIIKRSLESAKVPCHLEPVGQYRSDGKRPDGASVVPWRGGNILCVYQCIAPPPQVRGWWGLGGDLTMQNDNFPDPGMTSLCQIPSYTTTLMVGVKWGFALMQVLQDNQGISKTALLFA